MATAPARDPLSVLLRSKAMSPPLRFVKYIFVSSAERAPVAAPKLVLTTASAAMLPEFVALGKSRDGPELKPYPLNR